MQGGEIGKVFFKAWRLLVLLTPRKDAQPFLSSLPGREELQEAAVPLLPLTSCTAEAWLLGHKVTA